MQLCIKDILLDLMCECQKPDQTLSCNKSLYQDGWMPLMITSVSPGWLDGATCSEL